MKPAVVFISTSAQQTAVRAAAFLEGECYGPLIGGDEGTEGVAQRLQALFMAGRPMIGVCAAGILIRALVPVLSNKRVEPPVVVLAEDGSSAVPLLGGHQGANALARRLADAMAGHAAITTAGDLRFGVALDEPPPGWTLANPSDAKSVMAALLSGQSVRLIGNARWIAESRLPLSDTGAISLVATTRAATGNAQSLVYQPRRLVVGVGCERDAPAAHVVDLVRGTISRHGLSAAAVACVASLDLKADEPAIHAVAHDLGVAVRLFDAARLEAETSRLANPSPTVFREVGCHGVAEAAALAATGPSGLLVAPKEKGQRATCAIAEAPEIVDPTTVGRARGRVSIVGIGPGDPAWRTPEASSAIETADTVIGYGYYNELIADLAPHVERVSYPLGAERQRALAALTAAGNGQNVALISSGDPGIYAMASLVFECLEADALPDGAARAEVVVAPGISALQAVAARCGAPLGHDFCAISLSDLLTPWPVIRARIRAAAEADFVVAFYNPVSARRRTQLVEAKSVLLDHRPPETPVVVARLVGRCGEDVNIVELSELDTDAVDMMTLVLVGSTTTRRVEGGGREWIVTPRGYHRKDGTS